MGSGLKKRRRKKERKREREREREREKEKRRHRIVISPRGRQLAVNFRHTTSHVNNNLNVFGVWG